MGAGGHQVRTFNGFLCLKVGTERCPYELGCNAAGERCWTPRCGCAAVVVLVVYVMPCRPLSLGSQIETRLPVFPCLGCTAIVCSCAILLVLREDLGQVNGYVMLPAAFTQTCSPDPWTWKRVHMG